MSMYVCMYVMTIENNGYLFHAQTIINKYE
jgi:hypothetical protein